MLKMIKIIHLQVQKTSVYQVCKYNGIIQTFPDTSQNTKCRQAQLNKHVLIIELFLLTIKQLTLRMALTPTKSIKFTEEKSRIIFLTSQNLSSSRLSLVVSLSSMITFVFSSSY